MPPPPSALPQPMGKFKNGCCLFSKYFGFASDVYKCDKHLFFSISATTVRLLIKSYLKTLPQTMEKDICCFRKVIASFLLNNSLFDPGLF